MSYQLIIPDSALCQKATQLVKELSPDFLFNHCGRTYHFGRLLGEREKLKVDLELFYIGAIMHDLGLTHACDRGCSFEQDGAKAAEEFLLSHRYPQEKLDIVREAIILHTMVEAESKRPEIALVHFGAGFDIGHFHIQDLPSERVQEILEAYPRLGFKKAFTEVLMKDASQKPGTLSDQLLQWGIEKMIVEAGFSE
ncbi:metal dependent phosphohydrolase [Paenibacillus mucilaginosus 3016]|uniref:Metal dependent phosphohydrolase n=1 Tax=Paenibacillus mucilaginosus 3016 TaxID=1116391 RepID=H6NMQ6_9BACL|nr:HD domain-containing protein [Paenibacillus mucilaginosus]AFC30393.1 metal dependent phosphohydrolase [Paenibacillus mucilaginosus 3016]WFA19031.1 HD domain-containing protein [Paenibacillus mucilaginosus]